jgi:hypothetical protein
MDEEKNVGGLSSAIIPASEESHENHSQDPKQAPPKYKSEVLVLKLTSTVENCTFLL